METDLERYTQAYPQSRAELESLQRIIVFQADLAARVKLGPALALDTAHARWQAGLPLLSGEPLAVSPRLLRDALEGLRAALSGHGQAQTTLDSLLASGYVDSTATESFLNDLSDGLSRNGAAHLRQLAAQIEVDPDLLALLLHTVFAPFVQQQVMPYRPWLDTFVWRHGYCSLCGAEPSMARLAREDGRRILVCSLCRSEWRFDRLRCPFCEADSAPHYRHFTVEGDPAHRVDCCEQCRRYLKTIDERVLAYEVNLRAEEIVTAHLDRLAHEQGYH